MSIVRGKFDFEGHFTMIPNEWVRDERLSFKARGLLALLMSHSENWSVSVKSLASQGPDGIDAIRTAISELENLGYLCRHRQRGEDGQLGGVDYLLGSSGHAGGVDSADVTEQGLDKPNVDNPILDNPTPKKNKGKKNNLKKNPHSPPEGDGVFDSVYDSWPKKVERKQAKHRFALASRKHPGGVQGLADDVRRFAAAYRTAGVEKRFVPALGAWLNGERWTDELPTSPRQAPRTPQRQQKPLKTVAEVRATRERIMNGG